MSLSSTPLGRTHSVDSPIYIKREYSEAEKLKNNARIHAFCRITLRSLDAIEISKQTWRGDVVIEMLCFIRGDVPSLDGSYDTLPKCLKKEGLYPDLQENLSSPSQIIPMNDDLVHPHSIEMRRNAIDTIDTFLPFYISNLEDTRTVPNDKWMTVHVAGTLEIENNKTRDYSIFSVTTRLTGNFKQKFDLSEFPFDIQRLLVEIRQTKCEEPFQLSTPPGYWPENESSNQNKSWWEKSLENAKKDIVIPDWLEGILNHAGKIDPNKRRNDQVMWPWRRTLNKPFRGLASEKQPLPPVAGSSMVKESFVDRSAVMSEWRAFEFAECAEDWTDPKASRSSVTYKLFKASYVVSRHPMRVFLSKLLPSAMISCASFIIFALPPDDASGRMQILTALLISAVTVHGDIASLTEEMSFLVYYSVSCLAVLIGAAIITFISKILVRSSISSKETFDYCAIGTLLVLWIFNNFYFFLWYRQSRKVQQRLELRDEFLERLQKQEDEQVRKKE
jgi:hypothetical protein